MESKEPEEFKRDKEKVNAMARYSGLGIQMIMVLLAGTFGGQYLDEKIGNQVPVITIILIMLSLFGSMYMLYKEVTRDN